MSEPHASQHPRSWERSPRLLAWPYGWQRPAKTEEWAYEQYSPVPAGTAFAQLISFPWATLLDLLDRNQTARARHCLDALSSAPPRTTLIRATVCQHIHARRLLPYFETLEITDLFWPHARLGETLVGNIRVHPFPIYPVRCFAHQHACATTGQSPAERKYLYSFVGAYSPGLYVTAVREWIFQLPSTPRALVERRGEWHYEPQVYGEQVAQRAMTEEERLSHAERSAEYDRTLQDSVFSLCPSGSGPNSIRLWESLGFGCIPVLLADTLRLPGDQSEWNEAILRVPETREAVAALPARLAAIADDPARLLRMQQAGRRLWHRYGERGPQEVLGVLGDSGWVRAQLAAGPAPVGRPVQA